MNTRILSILAAAVLAACGGANTSSVDSSQKALTRQPSTKQAASGYQTAVEALYIAYFGRPADPNGLANFEAALQAAGAPETVAGLAQAYASNATIKSLIDSFGTSGESQTLYGGGNTTSFVTAVFTNVLNRQPASAGLQFWVNAIDSGSLTQGDAALAIAAGALTNTTTQGLLDAQLINNRLAVAAYFTSQVGADGATSAYAGSSAASAARAMLAGVTSSTVVASYQATADSTITGLLNTQQGNATNTPAAQADGLQFHPSSFNWILNPGMSQNFDVFVNVTNASLFSKFSTVYAMVEDSAGVLSSSVSIVQNGSAARYNATLSSSPTLPVGHYQGNILLKLCGDPQCQSPVAGSPWAFPYDITVTSATYAQPTSIAFDTSGNLFVADVSNVDEVTAGGKSSLFSSFRFKYLFGLAVDETDNLFVTDENAYVYKISSSGAVSPVAQGAFAYSYLNGIAVDTADNVYIADTANSAILKVTPAGIESAFAGQNPTSFQVFLTSSGFADGTGAAAKFNGPVGLAFDGAGNLYVADTGNNAIRKISPGGAVTTLAGSPTGGSADGTGAAAKFDGPTGLAVDSSGNVYVADTGNNIIRMVTPAGVVTTLAGKVGVTNTADNPNAGYSNGAGTSARFYRPTGIAVSQSGNIYVADSGNGVIRVVTPSGQVSTLVASAQ